MCVDDALELEPQIVAQLVKIAVQTMTVLLRHHHFIHANDANDNEYEDGIMTGGHVFTDKRSDGR